MADSADFAEARHLEDLKLSQDISDATAKREAQIFSRNGKEFTLTGETNIRAGTEIKVTTERPSMALRLSELDSGSWVIFDLPGFSTAASGTPQNSLDALRKASDTSYYKDKDSNGEGARISGPGAGGSSVQVSRQAESCRMSKSPRRRLESADRGRS